MVIAYVQVRGDEARRVKKDVFVAFDRLASSARLLGSTVNVLMRMK